MQKSEPNLTLAERRYSPAPQLHTHDFYQIVFPRHGELYLTIEGRDGAVGPHGWAVIHPAMAHSFWAAETSRFLVAELPAPVLDAACAQLDIATIRSTVYLPLSERSPALRDLLAGEVAAGGPASPFAADALANYTAALLAQALSTRITSPAPPRRAIAERARDYRDAHACTPLRLADVVAAAGTSTAHLQRSFRAAFGVSIVAYLHERRLQTAQHLLRTTDLPIDAVAEAVGFASQSAFTRLFHRAIGLPPARYRTRAWSESDNDPA
jgi:AraC-like DNA-binding protein